MALDFLLFPPPMNDKFTAHDYIYSFFVQLFPLLCLLYFIPSEAKQNYQLPSALPDVGICEPIRTMLYSIAFFPPKPQTE